MKFETPRLKDRLSRTEYMYNYQDQLAMVSQNGQVIAEYGYDANRQRVYAKTYSKPYESEKYYVWSGGNRDPQLKPKDAMDQLFMDHDKGYEKGIRPVADARLVRGLRNLTPTNPRMENYRSLALDYFSLKLYLQTGQIH